MWVRQITSGITDTKDKVNLIFQFSLGNLNILYDLSNISRIDKLYSVKEDCGTGCRLIKVWIWSKCWCPTKPKTNI